MSTHLLNFKDCSIILGSDLIYTQLLIGACQSTRVVIVTDSNVKKLFGEKLLSFLQNEGKEVYLISFGAGEASKTRKTKEYIEDEMQKMGIGSDVTLIALGGGVVTDLVGFVAATYRRGVPFISIPTTLLGMIDASIGGKTGVNTPFGKNLIGSFYLPQTVIIDDHFLKSLSQEQFNEGLVEMIKTALIYDEDLFKEMKSFLEAPGEKELFNPLIYKCCEIKLSVIEEDFEEKKGKRRILNFGHTVAHAIETYFNYEVTHGKAVACGIIAESYMALEMEFLSQKDFHEIVDILKPYALTKTFNEEKLIEIMKTDKKSLSHLPRFVMIKKIGEVDSCSGEYCMPLENEVILSGLKFLLDLKDL